LSVNSTRLDNQRVASLGSMKITFDDSSYITHNIQSLGTTVYDPGSSRLPVQVEGMGQTWLVANMPLPVSYPGGAQGSITKGEYDQNDVWIITLYPDSA